jgi:hypothetical protein
MSDSSFDLVIRDQQEGSDIRLPVSHEKLGGFISSLLGQPQTIERELYGSFNIDHSWLLHVHSLIDQRIKQQSHASLTDFKAVVFYENNLKRTLNSIESFEHFSETKKIASQSVRITWTYLINFPNKELPEKQEISLYVSAKAPVASKPEDPIRRMYSPRHKVGAISYRINHTERTWGDDIETLIKQELDLILEEEPVHSVFSLILALLAMVFMLGGLAFPELMNEIIQSQQMEALFENYQDTVDLEATTLVELGDKVNLVLQAVNPNNGINKVGLGYRFTLLIFGLAMAVWCMFLAEREKPSFVVLTKAAEEKMKSHVSKEKRSYLVLVLSFLFSVAAGVIGNYIYYIVTTT